MIKKFTEQDMQNYADYVAKAVLSNIQPDLAHWYAEWHKTAKKVIDLSVFIESGVDVELGDFQGVFFLGGHLTHIIEKGSSSMYNASDSTNAHSYARPRMNHIHAWQGGECPLPEGFRVKVWFRNTLYAPVDRPATSIRWCHDGDLYDIIAFEVLGLADGYVMPWEQDK
jgi:hypothetical protein